MRFRRKSKPSPVAPSVGARASRVAAPAGAQNWVLLVLDSCRFDSFESAKTPNLDKLGSLERRWSYATWTAPSHYNLLLGLLPHDTPKRSWSADIYAEEYQRYAARLGVELDFRKLAPELWLPDYLRKLGWHTGAWVSMPILNETVPLNKGFDDYKLRDRHNDLAGIIDDLRFYDDRPSFWLINAGETHYPYEIPTREYQPLPRLSGLHGAVKRFGETPSEAPEFFKQEMMDKLRNRQVEAVHYVDSLLPILREMVPDNTWLTVTSDHGECFGEDNYFGHGPIHHPKVLEVPLLEGKLR